MTESLIKSIAYIFNLKKILLGLSFFLFSLIFFFAIFLVDVCKNVPLPKNLKCENIAVLTGGKNRIKLALDSIKQFHAENVFISGVHEKTKLQDILIDRDVGDVTISLGYKAKNTKGNAKEIRDFVKDMGINEIILVTSDYHMRRSIRELSKYCEDLIVYPLKVRSNFDLKFVWLCFKEFICLYFGYHRSNFEDD